MFLPRKLWRLFWYLNSFPVRCHFRRMNVGIVRLNKNIYKNITIVTTSNQFQFLLLSKCHLNDWITGQNGKIRAMKLCKKKEIVSITQNPIGFTLSYAVCTQFVANNLVVLSRKNQTKKTTEHRWHLSLARFKPEIKTIASSIAIATLSHTSYYFIF